MKNPFRTRYRVQPIYYGELVGTKWTVTYRKWWQRKWRYFEMEYTGFGITKMPKQYPTKEAAIASVTAYPLN